MRGRAVGETSTLPFASGASSSSFSLDDLTMALLIGSLVLVVAVAAVRLSLRSGLPSLLIYLGIGLVLGQQGFGIHYENEQLTQVLGYAALVLILVEGGLTTRWSGIRRSVAPAAVLATVGVGVSVLVVGVAAHYLLGWHWQVAFLVAAVLASTDAAAVFSVLRRVPLPRQISGVLEAESGFNDAPVVLLVTAIAAGMAPQQTPHPLWQVGIIAALELAGGAVVGLAVGYVGARLLRLVASTSSALFAIGVISVAVFAYAAADALHSSGFLACYLAALVLGNLRLPHRPAVLGFATAIGWLAQIGLFVLLGLLAHPDQFLTVLGPALVVGAALLLLGRPLSVFVSLLPFGMSWRTKAFLSWAGLRGAVPVVLATVPANGRGPGRPVALRPRLRARRHLHPGAGADAALGGAAARPGLGAPPGRPRGRDDPPRRPGGRAARDRHRAGLAHRRGAGVRAAPAGGRQRLARGARGPLLRAARQRRAAAR